MNIIEKIIEDAKRHPDCKQKIPPASYKTFKEVYEGVFENKELDLIFNTVKNVCEMERSFITPCDMHSMQEFECSNCGKYTDYQILDEGDKPNYCVNCGAMVINIIEGKGE